MANVLENSAAFGACQKLYLNEDFADVHFVFNVDDESEKVPANKANLAVSSPVFRTMFFGSLPEKGDVPISDADAEAFKEFLQLFYLGEMTLTMENIETVVRLADKYDVLEHVNACAVSLQSQLTLDKMCWGYQLAVNLQNEELIKFCERKIINSPKEVLASDVFKRCEKSTLNRILGLGLICNEVNVFDACLTWAKHACEQNGLDATQAVNLKDQLDDCLKLIRFGSMTNDEFFERYVPLKGLFTSEEFEDIMLAISVKGHKPRIFNQIPRSEIYIKGVTWDDRNILRCQRNMVGPARRQTGIRNPEVTSFSSNKDLLLGEIQTAHTSQSEIVGTKVKVTIMERNDSTFQSIESPKVLYVGTSTTWFGFFDNRLKVTLPQPILIKPQRIYEVRLAVRSLDGSYYFSDCQPMVEMNDGTKIQFHRNPTLNYDNLANGWISDLLFNKV